MPLYTAALFIDGDNVQHHVAEIVRYCEIHFSLATKRAYGDWKQPPLIAHRQMMTDAGIHLVQQNRNGRNATDLALKRDVEGMLRVSAVSCYILVTGDSDFAATCKQIRHSGANVIVIGNAGNIGRRLRAACNKYFDVAVIAKNR